MTKFRSSLSSILFLSTIFLALSKLNIHNRPFVELMFCVKIFFWPFHYHLILLNNLEQFVRSGGDHLICKNDVGFLYQKNFRSDHSRYRGSAHLIVEVNGEFSIWMRKRFAHQIERCKKMENIRKKKELIVDTHTSEETDERQFIFTFFVIILGDSLLIDENFVNSSWIWGFQYLLSSKERSRISGRWWWRVMEVMINEDINTINRIKRKRINLIVDLWIFNDSLILWPRLELFSPIFSIGHQRRIENRSNHSQSKP